MSAAIKVSRNRSQGGIGRTRMVNRGDPGLLGALWGGVKGFVTGGPTGALAGAITGFRGSPRPAQPMPLAPTTVATPGPGTFRLPRPGPGDIQVDPTAFLPGGRPLTRIVPEGGFGSNGGASLGCPSGFHPNKSSYFLRDGTFIARGTKCVKNRRRNPANPRALDRAIGRLNSAKRLQHKLGGFSTRKYTATGHRKKGSGCR